MLNVPINLDKFCASAAVSDLVTLISHVANRCAEDPKYDRRAIISAIEENVSENGRRLIGELAGCIYARRDDSR